MPVGVSVFLSDVFLSDVFLAADTDIFFNVRHPDRVSDVKKIHNLFQLLKKYSPRSQTILPFSKKHPCFFSYLSPFLNRFLPYYSVIS